MRRRDYMFRKPGPITQVEIDRVCKLIASGRTFEPVLGCGEILLECCRLGLFLDTSRAVPTLSDAGLARAAVAG